MSGPVPRGVRVEIGFRLLEPSDRAPGLPPDTAALPYDIRVRGLLVSEGSIGSEVEIATQTGRRLRGTLETVDPGDTHTFGRPHRALLEVARNIDDLIDELR